MYTVKINFHVCYRLLLIFLKGILSKCFITVGKIQILTLSLVFCFVRVWLLDQHNNHLLFCQKFSITTKVFLDSCTIFLTVMEITLREIVCKNMCRHTNAKHTLHIFQAKRWLMAKCEIKLCVYFEKKDHTKSLYLICFLSSRDEG